MSRFITLTLIQIDKERDRLVEKPVMLTAKSVVTMQPEVLAYKDTIMPCTFIQAVSGNCVMTLNVKENMQEVAKRVDSVILPTMYVIPPTPVREV